jgi:beta-lactamase regulating signal transducer with metallopeptidase domain
MIQYLIKSTFCLMVLYGFFHFFLRNQKILIFNRAYLITALIISLITPLIHIPIRSSLSLNSSIDRIALFTEPLIQNDQITVYATSQHLHPNVLLIPFIAITLVLFLRFALNILKIITKAKKSKRIENGNITLVLVDEKTVPYSFLRYIFVNKSDFEHNRIKKELLMHEEAHCLQYHTLDIILLESINILFWFNPAIWLYRKAILLNHEYYADNNVLEISDSLDYQILLFNHVIQINSNHLVSNFKYSFIKNRLIMMTRNKPSNSAFLRKITGIIILLCLSLTFSFSQDNTLKKNSSNYSKDDTITKTASEKPELFPIRKTDVPEISRSYGEHHYVNPVTQNDTIVNHYGIDIKAKLGTDVIATAGGKVVSAAWEDKGRGRLVIIDHGEGYQSWYAHLQDFNVKSGDIVIKGQTIGHVGSSGLSTGPHLHFEIRVNGQHDDPLKYLKWTN